MTKAFFVLIALFATVRAHAAETEKQVRFAYDRALDTIKVCVVAPDCELTPAEWNIARDIALNEKSEVILVREEDRPDLFTSASGEVHRLMVTELKPGSPIYVNASRLPLPLATLAGLFAHEFVHHLGLKDDAQRVPDLFGTKISKLLEERYQKTPIALRGVSLAVVNFPQPLQTDFPKIFPTGLFPYVTIETPQGFTTQTLVEIQRHAAEICGADSPLWSSFAHVSRLGDLGETDGRRAFRYELRLTSRCLNKDGHALQDVISYATSLLKFDSKTFKLVEGTYSFGKTPEDNVTNASVDVLSLSAPKSVKAGNTISFEVSARYSLEDKDFVGCGALVSSPNWAGFDASMPLGFSVSSCEIIERANDTYRFRVTVPTPADATNGTPIELSRIGLRNAAGMYSMGIPRDRVLTRIESPHGARLKLRSVEVLRGAKIAFTFEGASKLIESYMTFKGTLKTGQFVAGQLTLTGQSDSTATTFTRSADGTLRAVMSVDFSNLARGEIVSLNILGVAALSSSFDAIAVDLTDRKLEVKP